MAQHGQDSILNLAKRVSELAELQTNHGSATQEEILEAIMRLQIAVEGPAQYVMNLRKMVRNHITDPF